MSLNNLGNRLSELGRREDALAAAQEAVTLLAPFFLRLPKTHAQWMIAMAQAIPGTLGTPGVEPDAALLAPIVEAFQKLQGPPDAGPANDA